MYKQFKFLVTLLLLAVSVGAWADTTYKLTQVTSVEADGLYVFEQNGYVFNNSVTSSALQTTNSFSTTGLTGTETYVWTLETATNGFYMKNVSKSSNEYLNNASKTNVSFGSKSTNWVFTFTNGVAKISNPNNSDRFLGNNGNNAFKAYATGNEDTYPWQITVYKLEEETGGGTPTCATPTFSPAAGEVNAGDEVTINCSTTGATIYYTTDGTTPTTSSSVYSAPIEITTDTTIKAYAVLANYNDSEVATAAYTIRQVVQVTGYTIDFENDISSYTDWTFENVGNTNTAITAHGGSKYGANINASGNGTSTLSIKTNDKVALPDALTCYVSKVSTNTSASTWTVEVSSDGSTWTEVDTQDAKSMSKGEWVEFTANLSSYSDVYVRISYSGSTAIRAIDDISLTTRTPGGKVTPTVVINASSLTNDLAGGTNVSAGTATAAVMDGQTEVQNVSVTWSSSDTGVATIDAATGAVILIATGTTTLTATFAGNDDYNGAFGTYELTVIDSHAPGSVNNPFTVAEAIAAVNNGTYNSNQEYYISGIVSEFYNTSIVGDGSNYRYYISDDGTTTTQLLVYKGKGLNQATFTNADDLLVGDEVTICGKLMVYNSAPEVAANNYLVSHHRKAIRYYLVGSFDAEPWIDHKIEMTKSGNTYTIEKVFDANTTFKIVKIDETNNNVTTWYGGATNDETYGIHSEWYANIPLTAGDAGKNFKIEPAGTYTFTVDADNMQLTVTGWPVPVYYLKGSFDNWGAGETFTSQGNGVYTLTKQLAANDEFKIVDENNAYYSNSSFSQNNCTDLGLYTNNNNMSTGVAGSFVFTLNTAANPMTLTVTGWPLTANGNMFVKVASGTVQDGAYLIVYEGGNVAFDGSLTTLDNQDNYIDVDIVNNSIFADATTKASLFYIQGNTIKSASGYFIGQTSDANGLAANQENAYTNDISIDNGNAVILSSGGAYLRFNTQGRFRYYKSSTYTAQQAIQLYKLVEQPIAPIVITAAEWATYVSNDNVNIPSEVTAYIVTNATNTSVSLTEVSAVPGNTPLVVNGAQGSYTPTAANTTDDVSANLFLVSNGTAVSDGTYFALGNKGGTVGFKKVANGTTVPAGKPYLIIANAAKDFLAFGDGEATGINSVESLGFDTTTPIYDVQGRRVSKLHKGIYIQNGRKVVVK